MHMNPVDSQFKKTLADNDITFIDIYNRLRLLAISRYEWKNLPKSCNARYLEQILYYRGLACFISDETLGILNLQCIPSATLNVYDESLQYTAFSTNYNKTFGRDNIILVYNNYDMLPTDLTIRCYAERLYNAIRTIDVNIRCHKTPILIKCDEKQRLTLKNLYKSYDGNEPVIFGDKSLNTDNFTVLKTDAPFIADKMYQYVNSLWSEVLTFLGINNNSQEGKKERLVVDEINSNNQNISLNAQIGLLTRQEACKNFNEMYGTNISCEMRQYTQSEIKTFNENSEGDEDE